MPMPPRHDRARPRRADRRRRRAPSRRRARDHDAARAQSLLRSPPDPDRGGRHRRCAARRVANRAEPWRRRPWGRMRAVDGGRSRRPRRAGTRAAPADAEGARDARTARPRTGARDAPRSPSGLSLPAARGTRLRPRDRRARAWPGPHRDSPARGLRVSDARPGGGPSPLLPLTYLMCAAAAFLAAAAGVAWFAPELAGHYYHQRVLALAHTVTLGWITVAIMGASYQLVPIVLERPIWSERLARWQLALLECAVAGMVAHFYLGAWPGLAAAAGLVAAAVAMHVANLTMSLRGFTRWTFTSRLVALGYGGFVLTALFGLTLAANRVHPFIPGQLLFPALHAHVQMGLLGWVTPMIFGVAARVYPMFLLAPEPHPRVASVQLWGLAIGVPAIVVGLLGVPALLAVGALAVTAAAVGHVVWLIEMVRARRRPMLDWGLRFALTGAGFLAPAVLLGVGLATDRLSGPRPALAYAVIVLGGWVSLTIAGMMLKIVPFLV